MPQSKRLCLIGLDGVPEGLLRGLASDGVMPRVAERIAGGHLRGDEVVGDQGTPGTVPGRDQGALHPRSVQGGEGEVEGELVGWLVDSEPGEQR